LVKVIPEGQYVSAYLTVVSDCLFPLWCRWNSENPWSGYKPISVAWTVDVPKVISFIKKLLMAP